SPTTPLLYRHPSPTRRSSDLAFAEITAFIENVSEAAGHARTEVNAGFTQNTDNTARHIFTAVVANAFYHGDSTGVPHAETFTRAACGIQTTTGRAIQAGVADNTCFMAAEGGTNRRTNGD